MSTVTTKDVLVKARSLIEKPENWTQGAFEREKDDGVVCFCAEGALDKAMAELGEFEDYGAYYLLEQATAKRTIRGVIRYNDADTTTHADVLSLFDDAIKAVDQ